MTLMPASSAACSGADHLVLVDRGGDDVVQVAARDQRVQKRRLRLDAPGRRNLRHDLDAEILGGGFLHADLHHLVERIDDARQEADLDLLLRERGVRARRISAAVGERKNECFLAIYFLPC